MVEIILSAALYILGAVVEHETNGGITKGIMYQDGNVSVVECHD